MGQEQSCSSRITENITCCFVFLMTCLRMSFPLHKADRGARLVSCTSWSGQRKISGSEGPTKNDGHKNYRCVILWNSKEVSGFPFHEMQLSHTFWKEILEDDLHGISEQCERVAVFQVRIGGICRLLTYLTRLHNFFLPTCYIHYIATFLSLTVEVNHLDDDFCPF